MNAPIPCAICTDHSAHASGEKCLRDCVNVEADLGVICSRCAQRIRNDLDAILSSWLMTETPPTPIATGARTKETPLPGGTDWIDWRHGADVFDILGSWVRCFAEDYGTPEPTSGDLSTIVGWLRRELDHVANSHPAIEEFADEIHTLARRGMRLAGEIPPRRSRVPCPTQGCGKVMHLDIRDVERVNTCKRCEVSRSTAQILNLLVADPDAMVPLESAAMKSKVSEATIKRWARAGKVERSGGLYRLGSVLDYAALRAARGA